MVFYDPEAHSPDNYTSQQSRGGLDLVPEGWASPDWTARWVPEWKKPGFIPSFDGLPDRHGRPPRD